MERKDEKKRISTNQGQVGWSTKYANDPDAVPPAITTNWAGPGEYEVVRMIPDGEGRGDCFSVTALLLTWDDYCDEVGSPAVKLVTPLVKEHQ